MLDVSSRHMLTLYRICPKLYRAVPMFGTSQVAEGIDVLQPA